MSEEVTARVALETNCKILTCPRSNIRTKDHAPQGNPMPLAELIFVLFAILAIATPFITLILLGKYKRLRENLDKLTEENSRQHNSFQREVADLKRQISAAAHPAAPVASGLTQRPAAPAAKAARTFSHYASSRANRSGKHADSKTASANRTRAAEARRACGGENACRSKTAC